MGTTYGYDYAGAVSNMDSASIITALLGSAIFMLVFLVMLVVFIVAYWRIFTKAGEPGWGSLVPFYSQYLMFRIAFGNGWLFLLLFIPGVNGIVALVALYKLCAVFGYGVGFFLGMLFLSPIFILILAFGPARYQGLM